MPKWVSIHWDRNYAHVDLKFIGKQHKKVALKYPIFHRALLGVCWMYFCLSFPILISDSAVCTRNVWAFCRNAQKKKAFKSIYWYLRQEYNSLLPQCLEGGLEQTMTWRVMAVMTRVCLRIQTESHSDHRSGFVSSLCVFPFKKVLRHHGIVWWWTCSF